MHLLCNDGPPTKRSEKNASFIQSWQATPYLAACWCGGQPSENHNVGKASQGPKVVIVGCTVANWKGGSIYRVGKQGATSKSGEAFFWPRKRGVILQELDRMDTRFFPMVLCFCWASRCPTVWPMTYWVAKLREWWKDGNNQQEFSLNKVLFSQLGLADLSAEAASSALCLGGFRWCCEVEAVRLFFRNCLIKWVTEVISIIIYNL